MSRMEDNLVMIDDDYGVTKDNYNWILIKNPICIGKKKREYRFFFPTLQMMSKFIVDLKSKDTLVRLTDGSTDTSPATLSFDSLNDEIIKDLHLYLNKVTQQQEVST